MKNVKKHHALETNNAQDPIWFKSSNNHMTLKMQDQRTRRFEKVVFSIQRRTLLYHGMPVQLEAKAPLPYGIPEIAKRRIKRCNYGRCRSS